MKNFILFKTKLLLFLLAYSLGFSQVFEQNYEANKSQEAILIAAKYYEAAMSAEKWTITKTNVESPFKYNIIWENISDNQFKMKTTVHYDLQNKKAVLNLISTQYIYPNKEILITSTDTETNRKKAYEVSRQLFIDSFFDFLKY